MSTNLVNQPGCPAGELEYFINSTICKDIVASTSIRKMSDNIFAYLSSIQVRKFGKRIIFRTYAPGSKDEKITWTQE